MTDEIRKCLNAEPFVPFLVKTADGKQYRVKHPDYVAVSPNGARVLVYAGEEVGTMLRAQHVVAVEPQTRRARAR